MNLKLPSPRTRRLAALACCAVILAIDLASAFWYVYVVRRWGFSFSASAGTMQLFWRDSSRPATYGWSQDYNKIVRSHDRRLGLWRWGVYSSGGSSFLVISFPMWAIACPPCLYAGASWWRARRRSRSGVCPTCGYDLTGLADPVCPECGAPVPASIPPLSS